MMWSASDDSIALSNMLGYIVTILLNLTASKTLYSPKVSNVGILKKIVDHHPEAIDPLRQRETTSLLKVSARKEFLSTNR